MRPEKKGTDRTQLALGLLEEAIASDAFVCGSVGRCPGWGSVYPPKDLMIKEARRPICKARC